MNVNEATRTGPRRRRLASVRIPVYNAAATLGQRLDALNTQVFDGSWEIVAVDNESQDGGATVIRRYQQQMPHLRLVQAAEKQGRAYACKHAEREPRKGMPSCFAMRMMSSRRVGGRHWLRPSKTARVCRPVRLTSECLTGGKVGLHAVGDFATRRNLSILPVRA